VNGKRLNILHNWNQKNWLIYRRWPWHLFFWIGYVLFRFWPYYLTVTYYNNVYLQYMLLSEVLFVAFVYLTLFLYRQLFNKEKYLVYFLTGSVFWIIYLCARIAFQLYYLRNQVGFKGTFSDIFLNNITIAIVYFLFITACKYFKDGYISQQFASERNAQQLKAEINNLKSQVAPHFLFNTLNNLYGLAVEKSEKLPDLMLRLSDLLRHSLYETQKPLVPLNDEINVLKSYIQLESIRLEDDLKFEYQNKVPEEANYQIAPLVLIVFIENAFKHAKLVESEAVDIYVKTEMYEDWFSLTVINNYNNEKENSSNGIGLTNVKRRLEVLYPQARHQLTIHKGEEFYSTILQLQLDKVVL
jgi:two-component system sensor histidine kinase LytS